MCVIIIAVVAKFWFVMTSAEIFNLSVDYFYNFLEKTLVLTKFGKL